MNAKEYLKQLTKLNTLINDKIAERQLWLDIALSVTPSVGGERVQYSGSQQKMANAVSRCVDIEREIDRAIDELYGKRQEIIRQLEKLPEKEYDVLHKRYVQGMYLADIAESRGQAYNTVAGIQTNGIKMLEIILNNKEN